MSVESQKGTTYHYLKMFRCKTEGPYHHWPFTRIVPFWFSMENFPCPGRGHTPLPDPPPARLLRSLAVLLEGPLTRIFEPPPPEKFMVMGLRYYSSMGASNGVIMPVYTTTLGFHPTINRGDFGQICTIFINIFIMMNWIQGFTWGLVSTM